MNPLLSSVGIDKINDILTVYFTKISNGDGTISELMFRAYSNVDQSIMDEAVKNIFVGNKTVKVSHVVEYLREFAR